jgi:hypothetical protein
MPLREDTIMTTILVLVHERDDFHSRHFMIKHLIANWARAGHEVVVHQGTRDVPAARVAVLHTDLTIVPDEYMDVLKRFPVVVNGETRDITKRRVSQNLVKLEDGYQEPVIVKTDLNNGGVQENRDRIGDDEPFQRWVRRHMGEMGTIASRRSIVPYMIFPRSSAVPGWVWHDPDLVVEKFLPERDERGYYLRMWLFLGDQERCNRILGPHPIVKGAHGLERVPVPVPDEIRECRTRLGFDYGKFDFVIHQGKPVLLDVSRTPTVPLNLTETLLKANVTLARGIEVFCGR